MSGAARDRRGRVLLVGIAAGLLSGLFGVGGGAVIVPGLVAVVGLAQHAAHATSLAAILVIAPVTLLPFVLDGSVAWAAAAALTAGAVLGAYAGAGLMYRISSVRLRQAFAVLLLLIAARLALPAGLASVAAGPPGAAALAGLVALGLGSGALSSVLGVGGGIVMVPALVLLFGLDQHAAQATSLAVILPTALVGTLRHGGRGTVDWGAAARIGVVGALAGLAGARLALAVPPGALQVAFAVFLAATAVQLLRTRPPDRSQPGAGGAAGPGAARRSDVRRRVR